jgi:hypothetical protein
MCEDIGYVNPKIGLGPSSGADATRLATTLVAGMLAIVVLFQGIQSIAMPLVREIGYTREIEDRVLAPAPTRPAQLPPPRRRVAAARRVSHA